MHNFNFNVFTKESASLGFCYSYTCTDTSHTRAKCDGITERRDLKKWLNSPTFKTSHIFTYSTSLASIFFFALDRSTKFQQHMQFYLHNDIK